MATTETAREKALVNYRKKLLEHRELDARLKESMFIIVLHCVIVLIETYANSVFKTVTLIKAKMLICHQKFFHNFSPSTCLFDVFFNASLFNALSCSKWRLRWPF